MNRPGIQPGIQYKVDIDQVFVEVEGQGYRGYRFLPVRLRICTHAYALADMAYAT